MITFLGSGTLGIKLVHHLINSYKKFYNNINIITKEDRLANRGYKPKPTAIKEYLIKNNLLNEVNLIEISSFKKLDEIRKQDLSNLLANSEIAIVCDIGLIVPENFINFPKVFINIHPSLLPFYRGPSPIEYAILNNEKLTGITICLLSKEVDAGKIIIQKIVKIEEEDNSYTLKNKIIQLIPELFDRFFKIYKENKLTLIDQVNEFATYTKKINDQDLKLNLNEDIKTIHNKVKAFYPNAYIENNSIRIKIQKTNIIYNNAIENVKFIKHNPDFPFFKVINNRLFLINSKNEFLEIKELQLPNKKTTKSIDFINGYYK
ncbi:MAG: formyltransferase family protein [bacterium]|nr:formyltransferase family protein [bacterium]